jgi:hypothetical protein
MYKIHCKSHILVDMMIMKEFLMSISTKVQLAHLPHHHIRLFKEVGLMLNMSKETHEANKFY